MKGRFRLVGLFRLGALSIRCGRTCASRALIEDSPGIHVDRGKPRYSLYSQDVFLLNPDTAASAPPGGRPYEDCSGSRCGLNQLTHR